MTDRLAQFHEHLKQRLDGLAAPSSEQGEAGSDMFLRAVEVAAIDHSLKRLGL
jgi:hypothetical protein